MRFSLIVASVFLSKIIYAIKKIIVPHKNYIIISDSDKLKKHIYNLNISNIKIYFNVLEHVGQNIQNKPNGVKDCLLDFFLIANSNEIHLLKNYWWRSGFSYYCSKIYKIPYHSTDINSINLPINESKNPLVYKSIQKKEIFSMRYFCSNIVFYSIISSLPLSKIMIFLFS